MLEHFWSTFLKRSDNPRPTLKEGLNIDLSERSIFKVNKDAFWIENSDIQFQIEMLNMSFNKISELELGMFPNSTFRNTKYLDLSYNQITNLDDNIFENLTSVADLNLAGNNLKVLHNDIFINNPLEVLFNSIFKSKKFHSHQIVCLLISIIASL